MGRSDGDGHALADRLAELARTLQREDDVGATLEAIVQAAVGTVPGAQHASISSVRRRREVRTLAATGALPREVDQAQDDTGEGPCLETLYERRPSGSRTWPPSSAGRPSSSASAGSASAACGWCSCSWRARTSEPSTSPAPTQHVALLFASHAAVARTRAQRQQRMSSALATHHLVGQAKGVLVERHRVTSEQAFLLLVRASQETNRRLQDVAEELVRTGKLPAA